MTLQEATRRAQDIVSDLEPMCERIMICGSIRRKRPECHDIDIVLVPKRDPVKDMFGVITGYEVYPEFVHCINRWKKLKGEPTGRYTQRLVDDVKVEISIGTPANFGCLQLIRTGNADFSHMIMKRVLKCGLEQRDGYLMDGDKQIPIGDERDYFNVLNLPYIEPENRDAHAFRKL